MTVDVNMLGIILFLTFKFPIRQHEAMINLYAI